MPYLKKEKIIALSPMIETAHSILHYGRNVRRIFLVWANQPFNYDKE